MLTWALLSFHAALQMQRLPVLHSSMVALEISLGREAMIDFQVNGAAFYRRAAAGC